MNDTVIKVENLSKKYILSHQRQERYTALRDVMARGVNDLGKKIFSPFAPRSLSLANDQEEFYALRDVFFEVKRGDRVGIIGRNGAGKSTLLKILSRITEPTNGRIEITGRVASLLEVGTGFHPELTGRENIFLNGAILGMGRQEIKRKFDEIVDFAEVERFLDTPVKRYSSGMYVRLAFAVAAHLEPEILIVDEVLAVGDAQFQKKCLGKMEDVSAKEGRTVLFVSHNMGAIEQLCSSALLLEKGIIARKSGDVASVVKDYVYSGNDNSLGNCWENPGTPEFHNEYFKPLRFYFSDADRNEIRNMPVRNDADIWINVTGEVRKKDPSLYFGIGVFTETEVFLFGSSFFDEHPDLWPRIEVGTNHLRCKLPKHLLNEGSYKIEIHGGLLHKEFYFLPGRNNPKIFIDIKGGLSESPLWLEKRHGFFAPVLTWESQLNGHNTTISSPVAS